MAWISGGRRHSWAPLSWAFALFLLGCFLLALTPLGCVAHTDLENTCKFDAADGAGCVCRGFEHIACGDRGASFYQEHVDEVVLNCPKTTEQQTCSRDCTQPLEVLYVHYLECPARKQTEGYKLYTQATNTCGVSHAALGAMMDNCEKHDHTHNHITQDVFLGLSITAVAVVFVAIALLWRKVAILESGNQALLRNKLDSSSGAATASGDNQL
ncbi:hypothetical protein RI054_29g119540 [Pseudoscourfieldia marina]